VSRESSLLPYVTGASLEITTDTIILEFWITQICTLSRETALFIRNLYEGVATCPSLLDAVGIRVPARNIGDLNKFYTYI
jgi:hypothetical protein